MLISGTTPEPPPISSDRTGLGCVPDEMAAERPFHLDLVADRRDLVEEGRDLAILQPLDGQLDLVAGFGRRGDRIAALRGVAVGRGQPDVDMLAGAIGEGLARPKRKLFTRRRQPADRGDRRRLPARRPVGCDAPPAPQSSV